MIKWERDLYVSADYFLRANFDISIERLNRNLGNASTETISRQYIIFLRKGSEVTVLQKLWVYPTTRILNRYSDIRVYRCTVLLRNDSFRLDLDKDIPILGVFQGVTYDVCQDNMQRTRTCGEGPA